MNNPSEKYHALFVRLGADGDDPTHEHRLFCDDMRWSDKENQDNIAILAGWVADGLMTESEANLYYRGLTV